MLRYKRRINGRSAYVCVPARLNVHYGAYRFENLACLLYGYLQHAVSY